MDELTPAEITGLLESQKVGHIAVIDEGRPYVTPVSFVIVDDQFCFRTGAGRRVDAIRKNPDVSIEVMKVEDGRWESVIASGTAHEVLDDNKARTIISALLGKYVEEIGSPLSGGARKPLPEAGILVAVDLDHITGRSSGSWFTIPTRPGRL